MNNLVIMKQPANSSRILRQPEKDCIVVKSLYGARQAGKMLGTFIHDILKSWNIQQSTQNQTLYFWKQNSSFLVLIIIVDDAAFALNDRNMIDKIKSNLTLEIRVELFGALTLFTGWLIVQTSKKTRGQQKNYIKKLLAKHNLVHVEHMSIPI